ncbi:sulfatase [Stratiformator vulcanicus]|uniref:Choline-sulfatase n=1 Tax=Stratiformator vulcanicus TaxID=2527980 RepID=A0A517R0P6_9PLAN|nr:sulfatase [Stratiformator vulcanicus]QDT37472.1 Choline-sulfatase [Stratiformator vulcanicus]
MSFKFVPPGSNLKVAALALRKRLTQSSVFAVALIAFLEVPLTAADRPNVLFIAIDDLNDWVGPLKGHPDVKTPNIDRLAKRGVTFTDAHCQFPLCGPSRASLMSGMHPDTLEVFWHQGGKPENLMPRVAELGGVLLDQHFRNNGYAVFSRGKIYHSGHPNAKKYFDEWGGHAGFGPKPKRKFAWDSDFTQTDWGVFPDDVTRMPDYQTAEFGVRKLGEARDKPFLLMVGFVRPHVPWYTPQKWFDRFDPDALQMPPYRSDDLDDLPPMSSEINRMPGSPTTEWAKESGEWKQIVRAYLACVNFVDEQVGKVLDALDESDYADETIVVLWSDHGYHIGEKNRFQKHSLWERSTHVPVILAGPGIPQDDKCDQVVGLIDIAPTLADLCDLPPNKRWEGRSLAPLLRGSNPKWDRGVLTTWKEGNHAVTTERYRLLRYHDGTKELYDREADPNEWVNLAERSESKEVIVELGRRMDSLLGRTRE